jgi:hypothetical protein
MFVRLVTFRIDPESRQRQGLFAATAELRQAGGLDEASLALLDESRAWFNENLPAPPHRALSRGRAVCWFKPGVQRFLSRLWERAFILRDHGLHVELITIRKPGSVTYEDEWQVAAVPWSRPRRRLTRRV